MRYNGGSLSKSAFPTSTNSEESEGIFEVAWKWLIIILGDSLINNLETIKILKTERAIELNFDC